MSKHTPGPWTLESDPSHFNSLTTVIGGQRLNAKPHAWSAYELTVQVGGMAGLSEMEANARLIAAAPELLEALAQIAEYPATRADEMSAEAMRQLARAAIAKATGENP